MQGMSMFFKLEYLYFTSVLSWILSENICHIQCQVYFATNKRQAKQRQIIVEGDSMIAHSRT